MSVDISAPNSAAPEFADAVQRAKAAYLGMPGLKLTTGQAARLWSVDATLCGCVLSALVESRFLSITPNASFVRARHV